MSNVLIQSPRRINITNDGLKRAGSEGPIQKIDRLGLARSTEVTRMYPWLDLHLWKVFVIISCSNWVCFYMSQLYAKIFCRCLDYFSCFVVWHECTQPNL